MYDDDDWSDWYEDEGDYERSDTQYESDLVSDLDDKVDRMMTDPGYYDRIVGWF